MPTTWPYQMLTSPLRSRLERFPTVAPGSDQPGELTGRARASCMLAADQAQDDKETQ